MSATLVDSSVLLDVLAPSDWRDWSERELALAAESGDVCINQIVYAEVAAGFTTRERMERTLAGVGLKRLNLPWASAWLVARAFLEYRRGGGSRTTAMPDLYMGAHAAAAGLPLLTRDADRVRTYFPGVTLVAPS